MAVLYGSMLSADNINSHFGGIKYFIAATKQNFENEQHCQQIQH